MNSNPIDNKPLLLHIVGKRLTAVVFVMDYLQLQFEGPTLMLTLLTPVSVDACVGRVVREGEPGWRDTLCDQITREVVAVHCDSDEMIVEFADNSAIRASLRAEDYVCASAVHLLADGVVSVIV